MEVGIFVCICWLIVVKCEDVIELRLVVLFLWVLMIILGVLFVGIVWLLSIILVVVK